MLHTKVVPLRVTVHHSLDKGHSRGHGWGGVGGESRWIIEQEFITAGSIQRGAECRNKMILNTDGIFTDASRGNGAREREVLIHKEELQVA